MAFLFAIEIGYFLPKYYLSYNCFYNIVKVLDY